MVHRKCGYWDCDRPIRTDHEVCREHYPAYAAGQMEECPGCGRLKSVSFDVCLDCYSRPVSGPEAIADPQRGVLGKIVDVIREAAVRPGTGAASYGSRTQQPRAKYRVEHSEAWTDRDRGATVFYAYILKLNDGSYYAGQTRDLRARMMEHRDGKARPTAGRGPRLVWFARMGSRDEAASYEAALKELIDRNPREVRRMIIEFRDLIQEVDTGA